MRIKRSLLCILCLLLLAPAARLALDHLPPETHSLIEAKYGGWSGVLRLWVFEGWQPGAGTLSGWLNRCITAFEKRHPGVYVQPEYVEADAVAALASGDMPSPDLLLLPPGLLASPDPLEPLSIDPPLRAGLADCGRAGGNTYAVPVVMGGYLWAYNTALLDAIPGTWRETAVASPPDEPWRQWGAALLALCSARYSEATAGETPDADPGELDLGLDAGRATPTPVPTAAPEGTLDCALPDGFDFSAESWRGFVNGELAAIPVTQREVRRLETLSEQGRGVDWRLGRSGAGVFTDQVLCAAIPRPRTPDDAWDARRPLCEAFLLHLLDDACQGTLASAGAFSVTAAESGYRPGDSLLAMERELRSPALRVPRCLDGDWRAEAAAIVRKFIEGSAAPAALWRQFAARLDQKPERSPGESD